VKPGGIRPEWQLNPRFELVIRLLVILRQAFPNFGCGCPDDWIEIRVVVRLPTKYLNPKGPLLEFFGVTIERTFDGVAQKVGISFAIFEERIPENPHQLSFNRGAIHVGV